MGVLLIVFLAIQATEPAEMAQENSSQLISEDPIIFTEEETETAAPLILPKDTPVHLMVVNEVTTKTHKAGHRFKLRVNKSVMLNGEVILPVGATAWGEVTAADDSGNVGKSGEMAAKLLYVEVNGIYYPISGGTTSKGKSGTAETVMGVLALGPLGFFAKGNNAKIKAGELMTAFTSEDVVIPNAN